MSKALVCLVKWCYFKWEKWNRVKWFWVCVCVSERAQACTGNGYLQDKDTHWTLCGPSFCHDPLLVPLLAISISCEGLCGAPSPVSSLHFKVPALHLLSKVIPFLLCSLSKSCFGSKGERNLKTLQCSPKNHKQCKSAPAFTIMIFHYLYFSLSVTLASRDPWLDVKLWQACCTFL